MKTHWNNAIQLFIRKRVKGGIFEGNPEPQIPQQPNMIGSREIRTATEGRRLQSTTVLLQTLKSPKQPNISEYCSEVKKSPDTDKEI